MSSPDASEMTQAQLAVEAVLIRERLKVVPEERDALLRAYLALRGQVAQLDLPEARELEPATLYSALP